MILQKRLDELSRRNRELEGLRDSQKLQSSKLASAVARAQEAEGERSRAEAAMRQKLAEAEEAAEEAKAEAAAAKEEAKAAKAECEEAKADVQQQREAQKPPDMRELLSAVKIAVLAPCLRLHINGADPDTSGLCRTGRFRQQVGCWRRRYLNATHRLLCSTATHPLRKAVPMSSSPS